MFPFIEAFINKKKLVAIFGVVIVIGITFLYLENIYNITHRPKSTLDTTVSLISKLHDQNSLNSNEVKESGSDQMSELSKNILNDNKNDENIMKCWHKEKFTIVDACMKCNAFLRNSIHACKATGYRETINCEKYGLVSRSCPVPDDILIKHYWTFETISVIFTLIFTFIVNRRKKYLDEIATERVRKQLLS